LAWLARPDFFAGDWQQCQKGKARDRNQNCRLKDNAEIRCLAAIKNRPEAVADACIDEGSGNDAEKGGGDIGPKRYL